MVLQRRKKELPFSSLRVYGRTGCNGDGSIPCYGGGEPPFIGAAGAQEVRPSPPPLGSPWTRSIIVETTVGAEKSPSTGTASLLP